MHRPTDEPKHGLAGLIYDIAILTLLGFGRAIPPTGQHLLGRRGLATDDHMDVSTGSTKPLRDEYI